MNNRILVDLAIQHGIFKKALALGVRGLDDAQYAVLTAAKMLDDALEDLLMNDEMRSLLPELIGQLVLDAIILQTQRAGAADVPRIVEILTKGLFAGKRLSNVSRPSFAPAE